MPNIAERVAEKVRHLPTSQQVDILKFVEFLEQYDDSDILEDDWKRFMVNSPALAFLKDEEDIYTLEDGVPYKPQL
jgi:hypothetical protein